MIAVGKPTVLVVLGGGAVSVGFAKAHPAVAIISMGSGGQAGAQALAEVLLGTVSPSGRLPHTMYGESWEGACGQRPFWSHCHIKTFD